MNEAENRPAADRAESARHARSNYLLYLASTGIGVGAGIIFEFADIDGVDAIDSTALMVGGLIGLLSFVLLIIGVVRAYTDRKKADETTATHFRLQIRTFWINWLYTAAVSWVVGFLAEFVLPQVAADIVNYIVWLAVVAWFVMRCVKGLRFLSRQEPYPNPGTWLW